jgi:hypothetical protein
VEAKDVAADVVLEYIKRKGIQLEADVKKDLDKILLKVMVLHKYVVNDAGKVQIYRQSMEVVLIFRRKGRPVGRIQYLEV